MPELVGRIMQRCDCMRDFYALATVSRDVAAAADVAMMGYIKCAEHKFSLVGCTIVDMYGEMLFMEGARWFPMRMAGCHRGTKYLRLIFDHLDRKYHSM